MQLLCQGWCQNVLGRKFGSHFTNVLPLIQNDPFGRLPLSNVHIHIKHGRRIWWNILLSPLLWTGIAFGIAFISSGWLRIETPSFGFGACALLRTVGLVAASPRRCEACVPCCTSLTWSPILRRGLRHRREAGRVACGWKWALANQRGWSRPRHLVRDRLLDLGHAVLLLLQHLFTDLIGSSYSLARFIEASRHLLRSLLSLVVTLDALGEIWSECASSRLGCASGLLALKNLGLPPFFISKTSSIQNL
mmetsp:Transcript_15397/g.36298  ORF Transcript_15397/g.36298 Transcript_15397/m.36298 type:complete len:249 (-) Transcript_15397:1968-2714(-)